MIPAVSVLMPVLQPEPLLLRRAVHSVLEQRMGDLELVVVEDPGGIAVAEILSDVVDARLRIVANATRTSLVAQRNRALAEARADLVAWLDADDVALPDRLALQCDRFRYEPTLDVLGSAIELVDVSERPLAARRYPCEHAAIVAQMRRSNPLAQSAVMARRAALRGVGGYRFAIDHTGEDYELWSRLACHGARFANLDAVTVRYRVHPGSSKATRLRATLRSTVAVKRRWWLADMDFVDRLRLGAETVLVHAPPALVHQAFVLHRRLVARSDAPRSPTR